MYIHCISIATEQTTIKKIAQKLLSKYPPGFSFFSPDACAAPGVRDTPLPLHIGSAPHRHPTPPHPQGPGAWRERGNAVDHLRF